MAKVKIYTTPTCVYCKMTKEFFVENKIEFEEINVAQDQQAAQEMVEKSGQMGVPVIVVTTEDGKEQVIVGFQKEQLATALTVAIA